MSHFPFPFWILGLRILVLRNSQSNCENQVKEQTQGPENHLEHKPWARRGFLLQIHVTVKTGLRESMPALWKDKQKSSQCRAQYSVGLSTVAERPRLSRCYRCRATLFWAKRVLQWGGVINTCCRGQGKEGRQEMVTGRRSPGNWKWAKCSYALFLKFSGTWR